MPARNPYPRRLFAGLSDGRYHIPRRGRARPQMQRIAGAIAATAAAAIAAPWLVHLITRALP